MLSRLKHVDKKALIYTLFLGGVLSWNVFGAAQDRLTEEETVFLESFQAQVQVQEQIAMDGDIGTGVQYGVVLEDNLNVRTGPGTDFPVAGMLYRNDEIRLLEETPQGWWKIEYNGRLSFVSAEFIAPTSYSGME